MRILLVEDETQAAQILCRGLRECGYAVDIAATGEEAEYKLSVNGYDLILLDLVLHGQDGFSLCRGIRTSGVSTPILMLTARDAVQDKIRGLDCGADDYVTKPYEYHELLARIRALLRRGTNLVPDNICIGDLLIDTRKRTVTRGSLPIDLTTKEYAIIEYLGRNQGRPLSRQQISEHVWDENFDAFSNVVDVYILRLRRKIDSSFKRKLLHTHRGFGYELGAKD